MSKSIFISYSRRNRYIARQLKIDLARAGCSPWMDESDIPPAKRWRGELEEAIDRKDYFFLLWSPEADESSHVLDEYKYAEQRKPADRIWRLRVAGSSKDMRDEYSALQDIDLTQDYWESLRKTLKWLDVDEPNPLSPFDVIDSDMSVAEARELFPDQDDRRLFARDRQTPGALLTTFVRLPLMPSGYAMSWLVTREDADLRKQDEMQVVLKFTGDRSRGTVEQVLNYLVSNNTSPQILYIEGPQEKRRYDIPNDKAHVWSDCIGLTRSMIECYCGNQQVGYFMDSPQALVFPVAASFPTRKPFRVYNLNENANDKERYSCVYPS